MSRHWKPEIVGPDWTRASAYRRGGGCGGKVALLLAGAVAAGIGGGWLLQPKVDDSNSKPDAPIEWHAVQAVPKRVQTPDEVAWEKRAELEPSAVIASPEGARQSSAQQPVTVTYGSSSEEAGLPRGSAARNDGARGGRLIVIDGDTFAYRGERVRILGIDAPETHPSRCAREAGLGAAATLKLRQLLGSGTVTMTRAGHDRYGRVLAEVQVDGQDVGEAMTSAGLARNYAGGRKLPWC